MSTIAPAVVGLSRDQWHRYVAHYPPAPPIGPLVGVTTALKIQDVLIGGDLAAWGANKAIDFILGGNLPPTANLRESSLAAVSAARDIGTEVHAQIEKILLGQPVGPTERTAPYVYAFSAFLAAERPEFRGVEQRVANLAYQYAGTYDFAAKLRGRVSLVDVKSGKLKLSHRLQLALYAAGEFIGVEGDPQRYPIPRFRSFYILLLKGDGTYELVEQEVTPADRKHALFLVAAYHRIRAWEKPI